MIPLNMTYLNSQIYRIKKCNRGVGKWGVNLNKHKLSIKGDEKALEIFCATLNL